MANLIMVILYSCLRYKNNPLKRLFVDKPGFTPALSLRGINFSSLPNNKTHRKVSFIVRWAHKDSNPGPLRCKRSALTS